jgi:ABC-type Fe3+-hydroxamate transport system substrate-binding protein
MPEVRDMLGRAMEISERPQRIISLVPSQTELLADLGLEEEVVGITKFCVHPEAWFRGKQRIGGTKNPNIERIAALKPDLILANKEENRQEDIEALQAIAPVWVSEIADLGGALDMIRRIGLICEKQERGEEIAKTIENGFNRLQMGPALRVAYGIWKDPWMWAGGDTFISDVISRAGWINVLTNIPRYPEVSPVALKELNPDVLLLSSEPYPFKEKHIAQLQEIIPGVKIRLVDGEVFSWYGSRLLHTPEYIAAFIETL